MKYRTILTMTLALLVATACVKKEDFDMNNLRVQGEFDPTYGVPLAFFDAKASALVDFIRQMDTTDNLHVSASIGDGGLLTLYAEYFGHDVINFQSSSKKAKSTGRKDGNEEVSLYKTTLEHNNPVKLGRYLWDNDIQLKNLYVSMDADLTPHLTGTVQTLSECGVEVYFDSITITMVLDSAMSADEINQCRLNDPDHYVDDGHDTTYTLKLGLSTNTTRRSLAALASPSATAADRHIVILKDADIAPVIDHNAKHIYLSASLNIVATEEADILNNIDLQNIDWANTFFLESLEFNTHAAIEYSAILSIGDMDEIDTIAADCSSLAQYTDYTSYSDNSINASIREDGSTCLVLKTENSMPFDLKLKLRGLDENYREVVGDLLAGDNLIESPAVEPVPEGYNHTPSGQTFVAYQSAGASKSTLTFPLTKQQVENLSKAKYLELTMHIESPGSHDNPRKFVIMRDQDVLKLSLFVSAGAHMSLDYPIMKK